MKIGIAADHGGFELKKTVISYLKQNGFEVEDYGAHKLNKTDDYPDYVIPLAHAVATDKVQRGIAICGSGVGACIAANKVKGARAALIHDTFSAHQGVEDDDMNIICLGGRVVKTTEALAYIEAFLNAQFSGAERHKRRLRKIKKVEDEEHDFRIF